MQLMTLDGHILYLTMLYSTNILPQEAFQVMKGNRTSYCNRHADVKIVYLDSPFFIADV